MKQFIVLCTLLCLALTSPAKATSHRMRTKVLKGSKKSQMIQNKMANKEGLSRIKDDKALKKMKVSGKLVKITKKVAVDKRLKQKFRYVRPETNRFLSDMQTAFSKKFGSGNKIKVNSAVRTIAYQKKLTRRNGNAAKPTGKTASSHPTGATVDIAKKNLTAPEIEWVRNYLCKYELKKMIEVTEEKRQACFHFMVFKTYRKT